MDDQVHFLLFLGAIIVGAIVFKSHYDNGTISKIVKKVLGGK